MLTNRYGGPSHPIGPNKVKDCYINLYQKRKKNPFYFFHIVCINLRTKSHSQHLTSKAYDGVLLMYFRNLLPIETIDMQYQHL